MKYKQCRECNRSAKQSCGQHSNGWSLVTYYFCQDCYDKHISQRCSICMACNDFRDGPVKNCEDCGKPVCYASKHTYVYERKWYHKKCFWGRGQDINDKALALFPHLPGDIIKCIAQTVLRLDGGDRVAGKAGNHLQKCRCCNKRIRENLTREARCETAGCNQSRDVNKVCSDKCMRAALLNAKGLVKWNKDTQQLVCWKCRIKNKLNY